MKHLETGDADYHAGMQDMSDMSHEMMTSASGDGGHKEYFYWTNQVSLFVKVFDVNSTQGICVAAFVFALLTIILEGFKCIRVKIAEKAGDRTYGVHILSKAHLLQTLLFTCEMLMGYIIMLTVMTFNGWLFLAVLAGSAIGYILCQTFVRRHAAPSRTSVDAAARPLQAVPLTNAQYPLVDARPPPLDTRRTPSELPEVEETLLQQNGRSASAENGKEKDRVDSLLTSV